MMLFKALKRVIVKEALNSIDVTHPIPVGKVNNIKKSASSAIKPKRRTVLNDVIENPESFILEAWLDKNEINVRVRRRFECDTIETIESNVVEDVKVSE